MTKTSKRLEFIKDEDDGECLTLALHDEDHTLGNSLRSMIMKNPAVQFCGYSMPHPMERTVVMQIQTYFDATAPASEDEMEGKQEITARTCFKKGLHDLIDACEHIKSTFKEALEQYHEKKEEEFME